MSFDPLAVAHAYAAGADEYAAKFGDQFATNDFDRSIVEEFLAGLRSESSILDVGCGPAQVSALARELSRRPIGIDVTAEMLLVARRRLEDFSCVCADVRCLPIATASCDGAICWFSLHNLPRQSIAGALAELRRTMRVGGGLLLATHEGSGEEWHDTEWNGHAERVVVTYYQRDELAALVHSTGFGDITVRERDPRAGEHQVRKLFVSASARDVAHS